MNRLTWADLLALGIVAVLGINIGANYGALPAVLALALLVLTGALLVDGHRLDDAIRQLDADDWNGAKP